MNITILTRVGQACYGRQWQTQLADALGVSDRTMRRFVAGDMDIPDGICDDLRLIIYDRREKLAAALDELDHE